MLLSNEDASGKHRPALRPMFQRFSTGKDKATATATATATPLSVEEMKEAKQIAPEIVRLRTCKLETSVSAPQLQLDQLFTPHMALNHLMTPSPTSNNYDGTSSPRSAYSSQTTPPAHSPTRHRSSSSDQADLIAPPAEVDESFESYRGLLSPDGQAGENGFWSSAVGRATTGGKSGRVIERLMTDNDRLLRERKLATVQLDEEVKRGESARLALDSLQASNANLNSLHESDLSLINKRDRRIQELREELKAEVARRETAEINTRDSRRERDETVEQVRREAMEDRELSKRATSQYDVLSKSWKGLEERYEHQTIRLRNDVQHMTKQIFQDRDSLARLEVIMEQQRREVEKSKKINEKLVVELEACKRLQEDGIREIKQRADDNSIAHDQMQDQVDKVVGEMRYVMNLRRDLRRSQEWET